MLYDLFICHASEDKDSFVRPLAEALRRENVEVWYDEFSLKLGDSIRRAIDKGLRQARFGVVILSKAFFAKEWPQYELDGLAEREMSGSDKVILPIWHKITRDDVMQYSPSLAGRKAVFSSVGLQNIISDILSVIHPNGSPLINARDILLDWGIRPPVITEPYWLNVVEASNRLSGQGAVIPEDQVWGRWSFPLPYKSDDPRQWGERLAWTAMQMEWVKTAEETPITILNPPKQVISFIHSHPGLFETCQDFPGLVAEYAPQITIPGFGEDLEASIEEEFRKSCDSHKKYHDEGSAFGSALTIDHKSPLCDEEWCLRHPSFGNYKPIHVAGGYFSGGIFGPTVSPFEHADHIFWLLSSSCSWLPDKIHKTLIAGMKSWAVWPWHDIRYEEYECWNTCGALFDAMYAATEGKSFRMNAAAKDDLLRRIEVSISILELPDDTRDIYRRFLDEQFHKSFIESKRKRNANKQSKTKEKKHE